MYKVRTGPSTTAVIPDIALKDHECKLKLPNGMRMYLPLNFYASGLDIPWLKKVKKADDLCDKHCQRKFSKLLREWRAEVASGDESKTPHAFLC